MDGGTEGWIDGGTEDGGSLCEYMMHDGRGYVSVIIVCMSFARASAFITLEQQFEQVITNLNRKN